MPINEDLKTLLDAAVKEESEFVAKKGELGVSIQERDDAKQALADKQVLVDSLVDTTNIEKSEYVSALQALVTKIEEVISSLSA